MHFEIISLSQNRIFEKKCFLKWFHFVIPEPIWLDIQEKKGRNTNFPRCAAQTTATAECNRSVHSSPPLNGLSGKFFVRVTALMLVYPNTVPPLQTYSLFDLSYIIPPAKLLVGGCLIVLGIIKMSGWAKSCNQWFVRGGVFRGEETVINATLSPPFAPTPLTPPP